MVTVALKKKKALVVKKPPAEPKQPTDIIHFGTPIETDKILVEFDVPQLRVTYTLKTSGEVLVKTYVKEHALMIIHGRISHNPHSIYTQQCVAKARIAMMKKMPID